MKFKWIWIGASVGILLGVALLLLTRHKPRISSAILANPNPINYLGATHPGNEQLAREKLAAIYKGIVAYRAKFGKLPPGPDQLVEAGFLKKEVLHEPDGRYQDSGSLMPGTRGEWDGIWAWFMMVPRPDGTKKPAFPASGERDAWIYSALLVRSHLRSPSNKTTGNFLVLYSDGKIESVSPEDTIWILQPDGSRDINFPGEAGAKPGWTMADFRQYHGTSSY